jgi:thienamycin biosynthesis protein ThnN
MHGLSTRTSPAIDTVEDRLRRVVAAHFHPAEGSAFWLRRAASLGIDPLRQVRTVEDLELLGETTAEDLNAHPLTDFIPRRLQSRLDRFIVAQTGGTTGLGTWTAYRRDEFEEAFVFPFIAAASHVGFPAGEPWLYVGPGGPHVIGKAVRHLATSLGSCDPYSVDFDPRWAKRLPEGSFARRRYLQHILEQAMDVLHRRPVGVLFTTPIVLAHLAERMTDDQRERIRGVHYGGMAVDPAELRRFQEQVFPNAVHLSGYGNTLFGCCLEVSCRAGRELDYFPWGDRLLLEVVDEEGLLCLPGQEGHVRFTRLDESSLIVRFTERDLAASLSPPDGAPEGFMLRGVRNPHPASAPAEPLRIGLY